MSQVALEFFVDGLKLEIWSDAVRLSKERYNIKKSCSTLTKQVVFSTDALLKLIANIADIRQVARIRDASLA